jgi:5-aminolevulinate synthase
VWGSTDYLGMSRHPRVVATAAAVVTQHGVGAGGTRNIGGNGVFHGLLEAELAALHRKDAALVFSSCFVANDTTLATLGRLLQCEFFSDSDNHASMIEGMRNSRRPRHVWRHNDAAHLDALLAAADPAVPKVVALESVYSMDGSTAPLRAVLDVARKHGALTFLDEVHAVGLYGARGAGLAERDGVLAEVDLITGTLGKAYGAVGGYVAGSARLVDTLRSYCPGFIFTTSMPPATAAAACASVQVLAGAEGVALRAAHQASAAATRAALTGRGLPVMPCPTHLVPVLVGESRLCKQLSDDLLREHRVYVQSINYPTVPFGTERLRITPSPHHTPDMRERFADALADVWTRAGLALHDAGRIAAAASA